jgi:hypothetical protein
MCALEVTDQNLDMWLQLFYLDIEPRRALKLPRHVLGKSCVVNTCSTDILLPMEAGVSQPLRNVPRLRCMYASLVTGCYLDMRPKLIYLDTEPRQCTWALSCSFVL